MAARQYATAALRTGRASPYPGATRARSPASRIGLRLLFVSRPLRARPGAVARHPRRRVPGPLPATAIAGQVRCRTDASSFDRRPLRWLTFRRSSSRRRRVRFLGYVRIAPRASRWTRRRQLLVECDRSRRHVHDALEAGANELAVWLSAHPATPRPTPDQFDDLPLMTKWSVLPLIVGAPPLDKSAAPWSDSRRSSRP